jgi:hypothetical protein
MKDYRIRKNMGNFRIRKETLNGETSYFVEKKVLGFLWIDMFLDFHFGPRVFRTYNDAVKSLLEKIVKPEKPEEPKIEYLSVNFDFE